MSVCARQCSSAMSCASTSTSRPASAGRVCLPRFASALRPRVARQVSCAAAAPVKAPQGLRNMDWTGSAEEVQALAELASLMGARSNEEEMKWFLRDRKFDAQAAAKKLNAMLDWREEFGVDAITEETVAAEAATGKASLHDRLDASGRPVILVNAAKHFTGAVPLEESNRLCVHIIEGAMRKTEAPDSQEDTILGIFDLRGYRGENGDLGFVRFLVDVFFTYYPKRLSQVLLVDPPFVFKAGWSLIRPWLKKYAALVTFCKASDVKNFFASAEDVPPQFRD